MNIKRSRHQGLADGYTLVEAMVAISLLMMGVAAAAALSMSMVNQEEINARGARALNWHENSVRLFQLGIGGANDASPIVSLMPGLPGLTGLTAATSSQAFAALPSGNDAIDVTNLTLSYNSDTNGTVRSHVMTAVRF